MRQLNALLDDSSNSDFELDWSNTSLTPGIPEALTKRHKADFLSIEPPPPDRRPRTAMCDCWEANVAAGFIVLPINQNNDKLHKLVPTNSAKDSSCVYCSHHVVWLIPEETGRLPNGKRRNKKATK